MARCEVRIRGEACLMLALWLLLMPQWTGPMLLAMAVHEGGHLLALWMLGIRLRSFEICAAGARIGTEELRPKQELICALAGPAAGLLLCLFWRWIPRAALIALGQSLFNLLPVYPMDGGRVLMAVRNICCKRTGFGVQ